MVYVNSVVYESNAKYKTKSDKQVHVRLVAHLE